MTLIEFLRARLDEARDRAAGTGRVAWLTYRDASGGMLYTTVASATIEAPDWWVVDGHEAPAAASVEVIYDERDVLAEVEAKRRIVDACEHTRNYEDYGWPLANDVLALLALPYADHPDYDKDWAPA